MSCPIVFALRDPSFDPLVGDGEYIRRSREAHRFRSFEIDSEIELDRQLDRQIARSGIRQDAIHIARGANENVSLAW